MGEQTAKFSVGQLIQNRLFGYRGVIIDIDPEFHGSDDWYQNVARSKPPKDRPWYHVLVDGQTHTTYVAERHLTEADNATPIHHPLVDELFYEFADGRYIRRLTQN